MSTPIRQLESLIRFVLTARRLGLTEELLVGERAGKYEIANRNGTFVWLFSPSDAKQYMRANESVVELVVKTLKGQADSKDASRLAGFLGRTSEKKGEPLDWVKMLNPTFRQMFAARIEIKIRVSNKVFTTINPQGLAKFMFDDYTALIMPVLRLWEKEATRAIIVPSRANLETLAKKLQPNDAV